MKNIELIESLKSMIENFDYSDRSAEDKIFRRAKMIITKIFQPNSDYILQLHNIHNEKLLNGISNYTPEYEIERMYRAQLKKKLNKYINLFSSIIEDLQLTPQLQNIQDNSMQNLEKIFKKFHKIVLQLKNRKSRPSRPTFVVNDEYDVQDLLHALLRIEFEDIREEEYTPSYAGSNSRIDFLLKEEKIIIEVKKTRDGLKDKKIGEQLIIDIDRYKNHLDYKILYCFIYDPDELILNPKGLENDLSGVKDNKHIKIIIAPSRT